MISENDSFEKKIDFNYAENGKNFKAGFAKGNNGKLYITTSAGGNNLSYGTLLEYNPSDNTLLKKFDFSPTQSPQNLTEASVMMASNGKIYGVSTFMGFRNHYLNLIYKPIPTLPESHSHLPLLGIHPQSSWKQLMVKYMGLHPLEVLIILGTLFNMFY